MKGHPYSEGVTKPRLASLTLSALAALVLLAGCTAPAPEASQTATPIAVSTPTPTPDPTVTLVTITAEAITLTDGAGTVRDSFDYFQPTEDLVAGLTAAFGFAPSVEQVQPYEGVPWSAIEWEGFVLRDIAEESDGVYYPNNRVTVTTPAVRGVAIETVDGVSVGDDPAELEAAYPDRISYGTSSGKDVYQISYGTVPLPDFDFGDGQKGPFSYGVAVTGVVGGPITELWAPTGGGPGI